jgi:hypothetical protein
MSKILGIKTIPRLVGVGNQILVKIPYGVLVMSGMAIPITDPPPPQGIPVGKFPLPIYLDGHAFCAMHSIHFITSCPNDRSFHSLPLKISTLQEVKLAMYFLSFMKNRAIS